MKARILLITQDASAFDGLEETRAVLGAVEARFGHELDLSPTPLESLASASRAAHAAVLSARAFDGAACRRLSRHLGLFAELRSLSAGGRSAGPLLVSDLEGVSPADGAGHLRLVGAGAAARVVGLAELAGRLAASRRGQLLVVDPPSGRTGPVVVLPSGRAAGAQTERVHVEEARSRLRGNPLTLDVMAAPYPRAEALLADASPTAVGARARLGEGPFGLYVPGEACPPGLGALLAVALLLRHSLGLQREATVIEDAVSKALSLTAEEAQGRPREAPLGPHVVTDCMTSMAV